MNLAGSTQIRMTWVSFTDGGDRSTLLVLLGILPCVGWYLALCWLVSGLVLVGISHFVGWYLAFCWLVSRLLLVGISPCVGWYLAFCWLVSRLVLTSQSSEQNSPGSATQRCQVLWRDCYNEWVLHRWCQAGYYRELGTLGVLRVVVWFVWFKGESPRLVPQNWGVKNKVRLRPSSCCCGGAFDER
jgi:hypothetical protein